MAYTFAQLRDVVEDAIKDLAGPAAEAGKANRYSGEHGGQVVNRALEYLVGRHPWRWRDVTTPLNLVADTATVALPANYGELIALTPAAANRWQLIQTRSLNDILSIRAWDTANNLRIYYYISVAAPVSAAVVPLRQLELAPIPTASIVAAMTLAYRKLVPALSAESDVADIPEGYHGMLLQLCRAFASKNRGYDWSLADELVASAIREDTRSAPANLGTMRGSASRFSDTPFLVRPFNDIPN